LYPVRQWEVLPLRCFKSDSSTVNIRIIERQSSYSERFPLAVGMDCLVYWPNVSIPKNWNPERSIISQTESRHFNEKSKLQKFTEKLVAVHCQHTVYRTIPVLVLTPNTPKFFMKNL
jgi:hypothetical protein